LEVEPVPGAGWILEIAGMPVGMWGIFESRGCFYGGSASYAVQFGFTFE
jgi:hypothetical protein